ncbi:NAD(P)-dependent dehydrogenase, short-chain alcohol dehydrogenase family [Nonomuraea solani]|uniref:NAD(P)-dependent dehydrogenase, short-chain alcohol dehydrogenase family n=1 Tax=Nonomuraea solani TaxID=1144553 RepID=A0A1H6EK92_9ACTN|nr:SDR family oxidoreductase [Nonomuraea solani]SEG98257.1 NAD(P)-dependent dehydrogenase, short-chain alcohol dehydrogenase family [Nonomuraea solani]
MTGRFEGKVALVTGASGVVGRAAALAYAREGAAVLAAGRDEARLAEVVKLADGGRVSAFAVDITRSAEVAAMVEAAVTRYGGLDVALNAAGIFGGMAPLADYDEDTWDEVLAVNLKGVFLSMKHEIAHMRASGGGTIVNVASNLGAHWRLAGASAYAASKAAVSHLTRAAARDHIADGVRVNALSPGPIDSPMSMRPGETTRDRDERMRTALPIGRVATPEEIAAAALWLSSPESSYVVGHDHVIDGGATA